MFKPERLWWLSCRAYQKRHLLLAKVYKAINYALFKCLLPFEAEIEPDIHLDHYALGIVVHPNVTIGRRVRIFHHVTLAGETWIGSPHRIVIGNDVLIGAGAILIARVDTGLSVGDGACIGAGAVVTRDVPPGMTMVGNPARPIVRAARVGGDGLESR